MIRALKYPSQSCQLAVTTALAPLVHKLDKTREIKASIMLLSAALSFVSSWCRLPARWLVPQLNSNGVARIYGKASRERVYTALGMVNDPAINLRWRGRILMASPRMFKDIYTLERIASA